VDRDYIYEENKELKLKLSKKEVLIQSYKNKLSILDQVEKMIDSLKSEVSSYTKDNSKKDLRLTEFQKEND